MRRRSLFQAALALLGIGVATKARTEEAVDSERRFDFKRRTMTDYHDLADKQNVLDLISSLIDEAEASSKAWGFSWPCREAIQLPPREGDIAVSWKPSGYVSMSIRIWDKDEEERDRAALRRLAADLKE